MVLAAIVLWLACALLFWCMALGATWGDLQFEAAWSRAQAEPTKARETLPPREQEPLSHAA